MSPGTPHWAVNWLATNQVPDDGRQLAVGDTLVVVTKGLRDGEWLDIFGTPLTDAATYTERFRRVSYGRMEIDAVLQGPLTRS